MNIVKKNGKNLKAKRTHQQVTLLGKRGKSKSEKNPSTSMTNHTHATRKQNPERTQNSKTQKACQCLRR